MPQSIFIVTRHYGCSYCNSEAYDEPSEETTVFDSEEKASRFVEKQKKIEHEENCTDDDCMCNYREKHGIHPEWNIEEHQLK